MLNFQNPTKQTSANHKMLLCTMILKAVLCFNKMHYCVYVIREHFLLKCLKTIHGVKSKLVKFTQLTYVPAKF